MLVDIDRESQPVFRTGNGTVGAIVAERLGCANAQYTVTLNDVTGGNFTLTVEGYDATGNIAFDAAAAAVQTALEAEVGANNVLVSGAEGGPWTVTLYGTLAWQAVGLTATDVDLEGDDHSVVVATVARGHSVGWAVKKYVMLHADAGNANVIMVGHSLADVGNGFALSADQQSPPIYVDELNKVYLLGGAAGQDYSWIAC